MLTGSAYGLGLADVGDGRRQHRQRGVGVHPHRHAVRATADVLRRVFRESDVLARLGGDEFAVLHLEPGSHDPEMVRARLNTSLAEVNAQSGLPYALAMSIGMVHQQADAVSSLDDLLAAADAQMYEIKRNKRKSQ